MYLFTKEYYHRTPYFLYCMVQIYHPGSFSTYCPVYLTGAGQDRLMDTHPKAESYVNRQLSALRAGDVPMEKLLVSQGLSRELGEYSSPSPAARAVRQLEAAGRTVRPGQRVRFIFTLEKPGACAWNLPDQPDPRCVDIHRYKTLFDRAVKTVLSPIRQSVNGGIENEHLYLFPIKKGRELSERGHPTTRQPECTIIRGFW